MANIAEWNDSQHKTNTDMKKQSTYKVAREMQI